MADQGLFQSSQHSQALLTQRREIAADATEGLSPSPRAETAGDLLLVVNKAKSGQVLRRRVINQREE